MGSRTRPEYETLISGRMMNFFLETLTMIRKNAIITLKWMPRVVLSDPGKRCRMKSAV